MNSTYINYVSGMAYADRKRLRDHESTHQSGNLPLPFDCDFCGYSTRRKDNLQAHIKRLHPDLVNKHFFFSVKTQYSISKACHLTIFSDYRPPKAKEDMMLTLKIDPR